jgi:tRNA pseudouridine32 synthase/23S rRNA pseudouridine746 synthase
MAEFWWGESPQAEIRHHLEYYPSCRSRCLPILTWMMQGLDVDPNPQEKAESQPLPIVYEDKDI